ncbi:hypothetical protein RUND412_003177 [Rhizina undulata]
MSTNLELARLHASPDNIQSITDVLFRPSELELRARLISILSKDPTFDKSRKPFLNHHQLLLRALRICKRLLELRDSYNWSPAEYAEAIRLQDESLPVTLHESAFIAVIESQGSEEQKKTWLPRCRRYEIIGCYAQTELAHGSNVRGLETTATYDKAADEFVISSPRLESTKWWIGGMGVMANHAVVQAILYLPSPSDPAKSRSHGPHLFIVPLRDLKTHLPLPGVKIGDIGPKAYNGFSSIDNGYAHFTNVRIPRENMLMRHSKVTSSGAFIPASHSKLSYGSMVALRAALPGGMGYTLAKAVTVAIRYCIMRRQFSPADNGVGEERRVIEYAAVRWRLYTFLARAYAYIFAGKEVWGFYQTMLDNLVNRNDVSMLAEVHSLSTALKVASTQDCVSGMEETRKTMGGHGFSHLSGVGPLFAHSTPAQTYEGDNYVISQQTSRSLLKDLMKLQSNIDRKLPSTTNYLRLLFQQESSLPISKKSDWLNPDIQVLALQRRAACMVKELGSKVLNQSSNLDISYDSSKIATAHADVFTVTSFQRCITALPDRSPLKTLYQIHALTTISAGCMELVDADLVSKEQRKWLKTLLEELVLGMEVTAAVEATDAFRFDDWELNSVLGRGDGKVYEAMWEAVVKLGKASDGEGKALEEEITKECLRIVGHWKAGLGKL